MTYPYRPTMPPYPFIPPFAPPHVDPPAIPRYSSGSESYDDGSTNSDDDSQTSESSMDIETPPPINVWPRLPPHHPYHLPPGYSWPDNLPPGHPGQHIRPPRPDIGSGEWVGEGSSDGDAIA